MPTLVEINGLDEGGKIGEDIWFVRVGTRIDSELQLLIRNLDHFDKLIVRKNDLKGREEKNLIKYVTNIIDDSAIDISIFRMRLQTQITIIKEYLGFLFQDLFRARKVIIDKLMEMTPPAEETGETRAKNGDQEVLWEIVQSLERFGSYPFAIESFVKSCGMKYVTASLDLLSGLFRTTVGRGTNRMLVVQIDGGYPFAFWWQNLIKLPDLKNLKKGSIHISGISQGDGYYPQLSVAGIIASILSRYPQRTYFLPVREVEYNDRYKINSDFYNEHSTAIVRPTFQNRLVFVGGIDPDLMTIIPYCLHRIDRRKTYEPFHIDTSAESFFKRYGYGSPENTLVVFGKLRSHQNKQDSWFCKSKGFKYKHLADLKGSYKNLCSEIESEIDLLHKEKRTDLLGKFQRIKQKCLSEMK